MNKPELKKILVKPVDGRRVLLPGTRTVLGAESATVDYTPVWARRIRDGDVVVDEPKKEIPKAAPRPAPVKPQE